MTFTLRRAAPNAPVLLLYSRTPGYLDALAPGNQITYLLGPFAGKLQLRTDPRGQLDLPIGLANDANLIGLRLYLQMFGFPPSGIRGSNPLELAICR